MAKKLLFQLELLAKAIQIRRLKEKNPSMTGIKLGAGFLWQHPLGNRQKILELCKQRLTLDKDV